MLGGVEIPHETGLLGHSDADVLSHAVADALLGAVADGDIGQHFPDSDARWKDADSIELLRQVTLRLADAGWAVGNVDATVIAEAPKIAPHVPAMQWNLAGAMGVDASRVSVKGTTVEQMGAMGRGEGIAVMATAAVSRIDSSKQEDDR